MKKALLALALGTFALGVAEFTMMGILGTVASDFGISVDMAGNLISAYALGVAIGAPGLVFLRRMCLNRLLLLLAAVICIGNTLVAVSPGFITMLCSRFIAGLPHGAFFGAGAIACTRISPARGASAVAIMIGGMTVANLFGVPASTWLVGVVGWRGAFAVVAVVGLLATIAIRCWVPRLAALPDTGLRGQFRFLRHPEPWLIYGGVFFAQASIYCWFSYFEPIMTHVTHFGIDVMPWIMVLAGFGMVVGNLMAGRMADRFAPAAVSGTIAATIIVLMGAVYFASPYKLPTLALIPLATGCLFGVGCPPQFLIVHYARGGEMLGGAGIQIAFNVSNAVAAFVGGQAIAQGLGLASPALVGIPFAIIGCICFWLLYGRTRKEL